MKDTFGLVVRPVEIEHDGVNVEGFIYSDNPAIGLQDQYRIDIGTKTGYRFQVTSHGEPIGAFDADGLENFFSHRNIEFGSNIRQVYDVMAVMNAAFDGNFQNIRAYVNCEDENPGIPEHLTTRQDLNPETLKKIKCDVGNIKAMGHYGFFFSDSAQKKVQELLAQLNFPACDYLIERMFIDNAASLLK